MATLNDSRGPLPQIKKGKINEMIKEWTSKTKQPFISFEYFPPKTPEGVEKLHKCIAEMALQQPLFVDFTWGAGGSTSDLTLDLSTKAQTKHGVTVNMHLTCTNQQKELCDVGLMGAKKAGICNIVALRGDPPKGQEKWEVKPKESKAKLSHRLSHASVGPSGPIGHTRMPHPHMPHPHMPHPHMPHAIPLIDHPH